MNRPNRRKKNSNIDDKHSVLENGAEIVTMNDDYNKTNAKEKRKKGDSSGNPSGSGSEIPPTNTGNSSKEEKS